MKTLIAAAALALAFAGSAQANPPSTHVNGDSPGWVHGAFQCSG